MSPAKRRPRVLFVDDEPSLLRALKKVLRPLHDRWDVETAEGGRAAMAALDRGPFDAVVTDARMPEISGEQVLQHARQQQPRAVRLVLSGQVDSRTSHRLALLAHQFLVKPCPSLAVIAAVDATCLARDRIQDPALAAAITSMGPIPLAPRTYHELSALLEAPDVAAADVALVISENVAASTMVLRLVSSANFALGRPVDSVHEAVVLLGLEAVREVVLLMEVFTQDDPLGVLEEVQRNSLLRARLARLIAKDSGLATLTAESALLADVGIYVLATRMPEQYGPLWIRHRREQRPLIALEREAFGFNHDQIGAALLALWNLPTAVVTAVASGHQAPEANAVMTSATAQALVIVLEEEARGLLPDHEPSPVAPMALQLGVGASLPALREWASRHWGPVQPERHAHGSA